MILVIHSMKQLIRGIYTKNGIPSTRDTFSLWQVKVFHSKRKGPQCSTPSTDSFSINQKAIFNCIVRYRFSTLSASSADAIPSIQRFSRYSSLYICFIISIDIQSRVLGMNWFTKIK